MWMAHGSQSYTKEQIKAHLYLANKIQVPYIIASNTRRSHQRELNQIEHKIYSQKQSGHERKQNRLFDTDHQPTQMD